MGCTGNCSYCGIKHAHGGIKSQPIESIVDQVRQGVRLGFREISLSGPDSGGYGIDIKKSLPALLEALFMIPDDFKINLRYIAPDWLVRHKKELMPFFDSGRITVSEG